MTLLVVGATKIKVNLNLDHSTLVTSTDKSIENQRNMHTAKNIITNSATKTTITSQGQKISSMVAQPQATTVKTKHKNGNKSKK